MRDEELQRVYHFFDDPSATADLDRLEELAPHCFFHLVDTSNANPAGYRLARYDRRATLDAGRNYTGLQFGDYPVRVYRDNLQQQLCATWSLRTPRYSGVQWSREGGEMRNFHRLLIPLKPRRNHIVGPTVLSATRPQAAAPTKGRVAALLSDREIEVLYWTAQGKTVQDIAVIISRSVSIINFHVQNAIAKLDAANTAQAAVRAQSMGYFDDRSA